MAPKQQGRKTSGAASAKNKLANMLVLSANPVEDIANWRKTDWVISKGIPFIPEALIKPSPELLAQQQLNAYNAHDLEAFLAPYADDVEIFQFPGQLLMKGKENMRKDYKFITRTPGLYCKLLNRIVQGNIVIDHEEVIGFGSKPLHAVAIYLVENGKIRKVYFKE